MSHIRRFADYVRLIKKSIGRFVVVGGIGFVVNFSILTVLYKMLGLDLLGSQLVGAEIAILCNFYLHNAWTYKDAVIDSIFHRIVEFHVSSWVGSGITTLILIVLVNQGMQYFFALVLGAIVALVWNFFWTRFFIWKPKESAYEEV